MKLGVALPLIDVAVGGDPASFPATALMTPAARLDRCAGREAPTGPGLREERQSRVAAGSRWQPSWPGATSAAARQRRIPGRREPPEATAAGTPTAFLRRASRINPRWAGRRSEQRGRSAATRFNGAR
jgi:hypothetical protein